MPTSLRRLEPITSLSQLLVENHPVVSAIRLIVEHAPSVTESFASIIDASGQSLNNSQNQIQGSIDKVKNTLRRLPMFETFLAIGQLQEALRPGEDNMYEVRLRIIGALAAFSTDLETYYHEQSRINAYRTLVAARELDGIVHVVRKLSSEVEQRLHIDERLPQGSGVLDLVLVGQHDYSATVAKIAALKVIYDELCSLYGYSPSDIPIGILRLEADCLWLKVFGDTKILDRAERLLVTIARFFHRKYTQEGKFAALRDQAEITRQISSALREIGPSTLVEDDLQRSAEVISKQVRTMLEGEPEVKVNETVELVMSEPIRPRLGPGTPLLAPAEGVDDTEK